MTAVAYLIKRIREDARVAYHFDPMTTSMEMLTAEYAAEKGLDVEEFRKIYYGSLQFERPRCSSCNCAECSK